MKKHASIVLLLPAVMALGLAGCESNIKPLKPLQRVELWVPDDGSPAIEISPRTDVPEASPALAIEEAEETPRAAPSTPATVPAEVAPINVATQPATVPATQTAATKAAATQTATTEAASTQLAASEPATTPTTTPTTVPATQTASSQPTTRPGKKVIKIIDPNQTARFIYKASYDNVWQKATLLISRMGFTIDRRDYRLGVIITQPLPSSQVVEPWKPQQTTLKNALENTINSQRRTIRLTISPVPGKPDFYQIAVRVLVERETNPSEALGGPIFVEGSGFGRNTASLRSDYSGDVPTDNKWIILGHDPHLEKKLLDQLFRRI